MATQAELTKKLREISEQMGAEKMLLSMFKASNGKGLTSQELMDTGDKILKEL